DAARPTMLDDGDFARMGLHVKELPALSREAGEVVAARTGGGVSLAVGMARVFSGIPGMSTLLSYWYHFAIMFEALFILTAIDTGTRIGRFLLQEMLARSPLTESLGRSDSRAGAVLATGAIVAGFTAFILTNGIQTLWPMFGVANQLLACAALSVGTTILLRESPAKVYALCTFLPLCFVATTTITAGVQSIRLLFLPMLAEPAHHGVGLLNTAFTVLMLVCIVMVIGGSFARWVALVQAPRNAAPATP
ncbi:MAG TPA: carbon starvation CstA 5TM domain-containing protein, partial [Polyangiaceae bacterium]|nr:carbon starvation CstA 5TM domain-containing protein [Polyangiaceae bacterium]